MAQSLPLRLATWGARHIVRRKLQRTSTPQNAAKSFARASKVFKSPPFLCHLTEISSGLRLNWLSVGQVKPRKVILYFHGGAYLSGSGTTHKGMLGRLSKLSGIRICAPDYQLLQEAPFPAAFEDARSAWETLAAHGYVPEDIILGGDSAGGGLMLALLADLTQRGITPAGAFGISPWTDLTLSGESLSSPTEAILPLGRMNESVDLYLAGAERADPRASPLFAKYQTPPPVLIQVGKDEALADDARRMADVLRKAGGQVTLNEWDTALHVFQILDGWVPEARAALREIADFIQTSFDMAKR